MNSSPEEAPSETAPVPGREPDLIASVRDAPLGDVETSTSRIRGAVLAAIGYLVFYRAAMLIPTGNLIVVGATTIVSLFLSLLFTVLTARALQSRPSIVTSLVLSGALAVPLVLVHLASRLAATGIGPIPGGYSNATVSVFRAFPGLDGLLLFWFAASIGCAISRLVREFKILLPMAVVLALVDIYVVFGGGLVTKAENGQSAVASAAMSALTVHLPTTPSTRGAAPMALTVGFADFLFIALFFACFTRFGIPSRRTFIVLFVTLVIYGMVVLFSLRDVALPALAPIAAVVIAMNWRRFRYDRSEAFALLYAGILVVGLLAGISYLSLRAK